MNALAKRLQHSIDHHLPGIQKISEELASDKPRTDKWSRKEILGHLIDSASNNQQRFIRIQFQDELIFQGYRQDAWVSNQKYQNRDWQEIINIWYHFNLQLVHIIETIPTEVLEKERTQHNLHQIAYKTIPQNQSTTLSYFVNDYIDHLEFHIGQIKEYPYR